MGTTRTTFRLPEELLEKADIAAEITNQKRTQIVTEALRGYLSDIEDDESFTEAVVERYLDDEIGFETMSTLVGRQNAESIRSSKTILDQSDELADDLASL
ncbi:hypothetical protein Halru_2213 [Halovivax ruber XH-70]|uniref:Ribbon-helix-helix protein, copG family n=1 Tax=Halovivax ruber (strain DSM 18193 / JCM 13892 / XH-70) TaxID=797302 RepID=L0IB79_HALRX|nr:hypothetical protein [Halovivax ruber]AGB16800.1 hypothetical protein Halru_2213 [Halovivax ruber XH-70]